MNEDHNTLTNFHFTVTPAAYALYLTNKYAPVISGRISARTLELNKSLETSRTYASQTDRLAVYL